MEKITVLKDITKGKFDTPIKIEKTESVVDYVIDGSKKITGEITHIEEITLIDIEKKVSNLTSEKNGYLDRITEIDKKIGEFNALTTKLTVELDKLVPVNDPAVLADLLSE